MAVAAAAETSLLPEEIERRLTAQLEHVSMLPAVAVEAMNLAKNPDCSIVEFSRVIEKDVKLATDILAMANSSLFVGSSPVASLHQAIVRLGMRKCKNLIYCSSFSSLLQKMTAEDVFTRERLWQHSFQTAVLGVHVNQALDIGFQGEEFTAGLMHDFGRLLLGMCLPERASELDLRDLDGDLQLIEIEQMITGTDHCAVGAWFARRYNLPEDLVEAIRFHHKPGLARHNPRLVALVGVCDRMASHMLRHGGADGYDLSENVALPFLEKSGVRKTGTHLKAVHAGLMQAALKDAEQMLKQR